MKTKFGDVFVRRKITDGGEVFVLRASYPAFFRYRDTELHLKSGEEVVLHFERRGMADR